MKVPLFSLLISSSLLGIADVSLVGAVKFSLSGERLDARESFGKRASISGGGDLQDLSDLNYFTNITLGGEQFKVLIDTGSSDLWVAGTVPNSQDTGKTASVNYAIGAVQGPIKSANLEFEGYTVNGQAFISAAVDSAHPAGQGLIGLGPNSGSSVHDAINNPSGDTVVDRIFRQNTSTPNYISFLLGRASDPTDPFPGDLTVGSLLEPYTNITKQPKLSVWQVPAAQGQHWQTLLDKNGILGPDGQPISVESAVKGSPKDQLNVIFDSGFSLPQVQKSVADAIYSRVPGALFQNLTNPGPVWTLPCTAEVNVTFKFGNVSFPVHPLDTNFGELDLTDDSGNPLCIGAFQPITTGASSNYDMILGMAFLRNAYVLIDFGDFVDGSSSKVGDGYIQLLPVTQPAIAHQDFVQTRLGGIDSTANFHLLPAANTTTPDDSDNDSDSSSDSKSFWDKYKWYIIGGAAGLAVLLIVAISLCVASRRRKAYRQLHDPAPAGIDHEPMFARYQPGAGAGHARYQSQTNAGYSDRPQAYQGRPPSGSYAPPPAQRY